MKRFFLLILIFISGHCFCEGVFVAREKIEVVIADELESSFYISDISDELFAKMQGKSYKENCTIPRSDLRYLHLLHKTLDGGSREGELVCNKKIAEKLLSIFKELYRAGYPIEKIRLIDEYDADDEKSMSDNNSSCFNFRFISHTTVVSKHGAAYLDRSKNFPYKIDHNDLVYKLLPRRALSGAATGRA